MSNFKNLFKHSWHFYKKHWKELALVFLPVEVAILALVLILKFGLTPARFAVVALLALLFTLVLIALKFGKLALILASGVIVADIEKGELIKVEATYKKIVKNIRPIIWIYFLQSLFICAVMFLAFLASTLIFTLPFIVLGILGRVFPQILYFIGANGAVLSVTMFTFCFLGSAIVIAFCISSIWYSYNVFLLEGRRGIDALAISSALTRGKRWSVSWRLVLICVISAIPFLIFVGPVFWAILEEAKPQLLIGLMLYKQYGQYGVYPAWPEISTNLYIWRTLLMSVACLVALPIFATLNFFLWKDIKASAPVFKEGEYTKTRKRIRNTIWTGLVLLVLCIAIATIAR